MNEIETKKLVNFVYTNNIYVIAALNIFSVLCSTTSLAAQHMDGFGDQLLTCLSILAERVSYYSE